MAFDYSAAATWLVASGGFLTGLGAFISSRNGKRENHESAIARATEVATDVWQSTITTLRQDLTEARAALDATRQALEKETMNRQFLEIRVGELQRTVRRLEIQLRDAGVATGDDGPED